MEAKYSKTEFDGFTHRFIVRLKVDNDWRNDTIINIYSNSGNSKRLESFINDKKSKKVMSFDIEHRTTKKQDEMDSMFINEILSDL